MPKDADIEEAIAILKASKAIRAHKLGPVMLAKVDQFYAGDRIIYDPSLPPTRYGESFENFIWGRIRLNTGWVGHPVSSAAAIAHEAVHLVSTTTDSVEQEVSCRAFDAQFIAELITGFSYPYEDSAIGFSSLKTARMTSGSPLWASYQRLLTAEANNQLLDIVLAISDYAALLKADWVVLHLRDWGGLRNRWATSLGAFVRSLANAGNRPAYYAPYLVELLEAIPVPHWSQAKPAMGDFSKVQGQVSYILTLPDPKYKMIIDVIERTTGDRLRR